MIASRAAYGGGGVVLTTATATVTAAGLLWLEAKWARRTVGDVTEIPYNVDGIYTPTGEPGSRAAPINMLIVGDSAAAGLGADEPADTPGALLARGLADVSRHPVHLVNVAVVGAQTSDVPTQLDKVEGLAEFGHSGPDLTVVLVGANDVTHMVPPGTSAHHLGGLVRRLLENGGVVVVGTCPDLGTVRPLPQPLRAIGRRWSRRLAAAQMITVVEAGGRAVSLGALLGPEFDRAPQEYFSADQFHPSSLGYRRLAEVILPSVCAALGYGPEPEPELDVDRHEEVLPISVAAAQAAETAGSELAGTEIDGRAGSPRGRWATVRHRVPLRRRSAVLEE